MNFALIVARAGSVRIKNKNIKIFMENQLLRIQYKLYKKVKYLVKFMFLQIAKK